jgi:hypothetical protein
MAAWLAELGVTAAAMESTGIYWWPVCHALAGTGTIGVCVCNAAHMHNAVARTLLCIAWAVMASGDTYAGQGEDSCDHRDRRNREHIAARYQQALARLGYQVTLTPPDDASPPPDPGTPPATAAQDQAT